MPGDDFPLSHGFQVLACNLPVFLCRDLESIAHQYFFSEANRLYAHPNDLSSLSQSLPRGLARPAGDSDLVGPRSGVKSGAPGGKRRNPGDIVVSDGLC
eukprot:1120210-Rhodomonas_salina.2